MKHNNEIKQLLKEAKELNPNPMVTIYDRDKDGKLIKTEMTLKEAKETALKFMREHT